VTTSSLEEEVYPEFAHVIVISKKQMVGDGWMIVLSVSATPKKVNQQCRPGGYY
jgi:hypothetical protein